MVSTNTEDIKLCERELDVLYLLTNGYENKQLADKLNVSTHTIKACISSILKKLHAQNRTEAVSIALRNKLIK